MGLGHPARDLGIERLEIDTTVTRDDYEQFLRDTFQRSRGEKVDSAEVSYMRATGIRYGTLALDTGESLEAAKATLATATIAYSLRDDVDAIKWMHNHVQETGSCRSSRRRRWYARWPSPCTASRRSSSPSCS